MSENGLFFLFKRLRFSLNVKKISTTFKRRTVVLNIGIYCFIYWNNIGLVYQYAIIILNVLGHERTIKHGEWSHERGLPS